MSAKNMSKMCNFVHKSVENARFSARKCTFCALFARGRGDFLAGQKRGFLGSRESRASGAASCENSFAIPARCKLTERYLRKMCVSRASVATASLIMFLFIDIRSYPKGRRLIFCFFFLYLFLFVIDLVVPRSVDYREVTTRNKIKS
jgi:hypothetical protein